MRTLMALSFSLFLWTSPAHAVDDKKLVDRTYPFSEAAQHWPMAKRVHLEAIGEGRTPAGFWYSSYEYSGSEHLGMHLDAPFHFAESGWTTEKIPPPKSEANRDYLFHLDDLRAWKKFTAELRRDRSCPLTPAARGATTFALPMKIKGGSAAPLHIFAFVR